MTIYVDELRYYMRRLVAERAAAQGEGWRAMKLFQINDCEWVAAETLDDALSFYRAATGCEPASEDDEEPFELDDTLLELAPPRTFVDISGDYGEPGARYPIRQALSLFTEPVIISTEY